jgi:phosphohistidine swiveling domain-containing protein
MALDEILQRTSRVMQGEYRKDLTFRLLIAASEFGDILSHITHDTNLNPPARPFSKEDEKLAHGQVYVQLFAATEIRQQGLLKSALNKFTGETEGDELSAMIQQARTEAPYYKPEQLALEAFIAGAKFIARISPLASLQSLPEIEAATANWVYKLLLLTCNRGIEPYEAIELALKNWEDYDWKRREAIGNKDGELVGNGIGYSIRGKAYVIKNNIRTELDKVPANVILIMPEGVPDLISVLPRIFGVVTDQGGKTSHIARICEPKNFPCVYGAAGATEKIKTGDEISLVIDNGTGKVVYKPHKQQPPGGSLDVHHETYYP